MGDSSYQINTKVLAQEIGAFDGLVAERAKKVQADLTIAVLKSLLVASPFKTGELRSGWVASVDTPSDFVPPHRKALKGERKGMHGPEGRANVSDAKSIMAELRGRRFGTRSYVVNNVRYVNYVNDGIRGNSHNAGFIEAAVENAYSRFLD